MDEQNFYLYKITNNINNKIYIGKTKNINIRWTSHKTQSRRPWDKQRCEYIHKSIAKHGHENFTIEAIMCFDDEQECLNAETATIAQLNSNNRKIGYNLTSGGEGVSGYKYSDEQKSQMNQDKKIKYLGENNPFFGKKHTKETKDKIGKANSVYIGDKNPFFGKKHSEESLRNMKENHYNKKRYFSEDEIEEIRTYFIEQRKIKRTRKSIYKELSTKHDVSCSLITNIIAKRHTYSVK